MRKLLWEGLVKYGRETDGESIEHCRASDYKYEIYFASGQYHEFSISDYSVNKYNAVSIKIYIKNKKLKI